VYWNAFKHFSNRDGLPRKDEELLKDFDDIKNDVALFIGWYDYAILQKKMPVAAQVFQVWWYALNEDKVSEDADFGVFWNGVPGYRPTRSSRAKAEVATQDREVQRRQKTARRSGYRKLVIELPSLHGRHSRVAANTGLETTEPRLPEKLRSGAYPTLAPTQHSRFRQPCCRQG
jgi:hypothetical protein